MTLPIFHDVSLQHLDQVVRETEAAVTEGLIASEHAIWVLNSIELAKADVKHAVESAHDRLGSEDTLVLPRGLGERR